MDSIGKEKVKNETTIRYKLADGRIINVKVSVPVKETLEQSDRQMRSQARKERRYAVALYSNDYIDVTAAASQDGLAELLVELDEHVCLNAAISALPSVQRRRLLLRFFEGLSFQEIAKREGVRRSCVWISINKAICSLRSALKS